MNSEENFGGKIIIFSGDFRQILPILYKGGKSQILMNIIKKCNWWPKINTLTLTENVRVLIQKLQQNESQAECFQKHADWLLNIGNGKEKYIEEISETIEIPKQYIYNENLENFINQIYSDLNTENPTFASKAILTLFNLEAAKINNICLMKMKPEKVSLYSVDTIEDEDNNENDTRLFPPEFLNSLELPGN
jgi:hypothetical protein